MSRLSIAFRCFFSLLFKGNIAQTLFDELRGRIAPPRAEQDGSTIAEHAETRGPEVASPSPGGADRRLVTDRPVTAPLATQPSAIAGTERAVQVLALLQRDARLIDFIKEDIGEYDDAQVGAAVRDMHASCRQTIDRYLTLEPIMASEEGAMVTVQPGFDPAAIKLIGNVTGKLPVRGVLRHRGWRAGTVRLPDVPGAGAAVIAPAEVEVS